MRSLSLLLLLSLSGLCISAAAPSDKNKVKVRRDPAPGLHVDGETILLVSKLPFRVHCGDTADLYSWRVPASWKYEESEAGDAINVTEAPEGKATVRLRTLTFNPGAETPPERKVVRNYVLELAVGKVTPPVPPIPPVPPGPVPPDELTKALAAAYALEASPQKAVHVAALAALYRQAAKLDLSSLKTVGQLYQTLVAASRALLPAEALPSVRKVVGARLAAVLPSDTNAVLTQAHRDAALTLFAQLAAALEGATR